MDIRQEILKEHSRQNAEKIVAWVGSSPERLQQVVEVFLGDEYRVVQRLAQVVGKIGELQPQLMQKHVHRLVKKLSEPQLPVAVKRNVLRLLQYIEIPGPLHGEVMNICFDLLADQEETVAVRVFSMTVLDNLSAIYPDIRQELVTILEDQLEHGCTAGFKSRAIKVLNRKHIANS